MTSLAMDFIALTLERQAVYLDHVVEHARESLYDASELLPIELRRIAEGMAYETREIDRAQQARTIGRQRLLAAGIGGADVLAEPVVVHFIDAIDQHEPRLCEV